MLCALGAIAAGCSDSNPPAAADTGSDVPADARQDVTVDTRPADDVAPDVAPDVAVDVPMDTAADTPADTTPPPCSGNADCAGNPAGGTCDTATGRCVQCVPAMDTCPAAQHCDAATNACVAGCRSDEGCAATDGGVGDGGAPGGTRCDTATHTCVACVTDDHCPLGQRCMGNTCVPGCDATRGCPAGQACCAGGCVDTQTNTAHCGACGTACMVANGAAACAAGACAVASCAEGFGNCDTNVANGCETSTRTTTAHCGGCGMACAARPGAAASCAAGACAYACEAGLADCDAMTANGCETDTRAAVAHCGGCGMACAARANATASCAASRCAYACNAGFADCDGDAANGCETDTRSSTTHCGMCGRACAFANAAATCSAGTCSLGACAEGYANCDSNAATGCEADTRTSTAHCGGCGMACAPANATPACAAGACGVAACATGFGNCDGNAANGCETNTRTAVAHCGMCGNACPARPNAAARCASAACGFTCTEGFDDCNATAADGCETNILTSPVHCGGCGAGFTCAPGQVCAAGGCGPAASCAAIHAAFPALPSGNYAVDPDGAGPVAAFTTFCDMESHGGGWTLVGTVANGVARRWNSLDAFTSSSTFGSLAASTTDNFKSPGWVSVAGADLMVETEEYSFGFRGLLGGRAFGPFIAAGWPATCNRAWTRSGVDFATGLSATQQRMFGFTLRAHDDNAECFPATNENAAVVFFAAECCWVNGLGNTPGGQESWRTHDLSLLRLARLTTRACTAGAYPCNANGLQLDSSGECYEDSTACKSRRARVFVR